MKKKLALLGIMIIITFAGVGITLLLNHDEQGTEEKRIRVVTSFYPVYIGTANVIDGIEEVELINLTENQAGCLHDYQLTAQDMRKLENADVVILNGGGMESFVRDILENYPHVHIIDSSAGISLLEESSVHEHEGHEHEEQNAHIWMNPDSYILQIENIVDGLSKIDGKNSETYERNGAAYITKVQSLNDELEELPQSALKNGIIIFHDAFAYLAERLSIPVVYCVDMDNETSLSTGEVAQLIEEGKEHGVKYIFTEKQLKESIPKRVAEETKAALCIIDSLVSGPMDKDAYLTGMRENINVLRQILTDSDGSADE